LGRQIYVDFSDSQKFCTPSELLNCQRLTGIKTMGLLWKGFTIFYKFLISAFLVVYFVVFIYISSLRKGKI
jgi:hypothetical protein